MTDKKPTVEAQRRRPGGSAAPSGRAEAPVRRRPAAGGGSGSGLPPSSGGGFSGAGLPGGLPRNLSIGGLILVVILYFAFQLLFGGADQGTQTDESAFNPPEQAAPTSNLPVVQPTARPTQPRPTQSAAQAGSDTWLVLLYQDADDKILERDIYVDLNEAERVGSTGNVQIVAQIDRFQGGYQGDGDWVTARRYFVRQDDDLERINSDLVMELGETNMADGATLVDFVTWAAATYPADHYVLILSDHGMGWPGGWSDPTARGGDSSLPLATALGDQLYLHELDAALEQIRSRAQIGQFELIGMDACLMGHLEVFSALAPHARYAVASQETEPALGWAYAAFLSELTANPGMSGADLGRAIVESYIVADERIVDDEARADFVGPANLLGSLFGGASVPSAAQVTRELGQNITLAAVDLSYIPAVTNSFNALAFAMQSADQADVAQARSYAQSFTSIFGKQAPPSYIDLGHFAQLAGRTSGLRNVGEAANQVLSALSQAVIAERHGSKRPGATGISIYFPNSALYGSAQAGMASYTVAAERFAAESLWDEFLAFHYTGRSFKADDSQVVVPERTTPIESPAAGGIQVSALQASQDSVEPGDSIRLSVDISGANIGYVRLLTGYLDQVNNSVYVADSDYLQSSQTNELNGVYYPEWGADEFTLTFEWEPIVFAINDGVSSAVALLNPESYGASPEEAVYSVEGLYAFADGSAPRYARLYFSNGVLRQVFGFTSQTSTGAPREITPVSGDQFTILEKWMDLDSQGKVVEIVYQEGQTLTFGDQLFTWEQLYAAPGEYVIGFVIEDLDGNAQTVYAQVTVR